MEGDLKSPVPETRGQDETAELTRATADMIAGLNTIIDDIGYLLNELAHQNYRGPSEALNPAKPFLPWRISAWMAARPLREESLWASR